MLLISASVYEFASSQDTKMELKDLTYICRNLVRLAERELPLSHIPLLWFTAKRGNETVNSLYLNVRRKTRCAITCNAAALQHAHSPQWNAWIAPKNLLFMQGRQIISQVSKETTQLMCLRKTKVNHNDCCSCWNDSKHVSTHITCWRKQLHVSSLYIWQFFNKQNDQRTVH